MMEVTEKSNMYGIKRLTEICEDFIASSGIDVNNVTYILKQCELYDLRQLEKVCLYILAEKYKEISKRSDFKQLSHELRKEIKSTYKSVPIWSGTKSNGRKCGIQ